jgi:hypothetical protein
MADAAASLPGGWQMPAAQAEMFLNLTLLTCLPAHRFWINNQSRMYLLEGTADLQHHLHLKMGDVLIFAQKEDSTIVLAGRPPTKADAMKKPTMRKASPSPLGRPAAGRREAVSAQQVLLRFSLGVLQAATA